MDLRNRYQDRSDDKETQYIPLQETRKRSDQYDTQELSAEEIRRRAKQEHDANARRNGGAIPQGGRVPGRNEPPYSGSFRGTVQNNGGVYRGPAHSNDGVYRGPVQNNGGAYRGPVQNNSGVYRGPAQNNSGAYRSNSGYQNPPGGTPPHDRNGRQANGRPSRPPVKKRRKTPVWQTVIRVILILVVSVFLLYSSIVLIGILRTNIVDTVDRNRTADAASSSSVDNILIIGTDSRDIEKEKGRSDSMILLSVNSKSKTIYMTSFLRDVYVYINDYYGYGKLNAAYSYGGPELLMDTIESNYRIKIDDYVLVSFAACAEVIDAVGGVEITLSDEEAKALNDILISEVNELMGDKRNDDLLEGGGTYNLNGKQALSYSRIRYVGNADFERTSRQREVLTIAMKKACKNPAAICGIFMNALPEISTNIQGLSLYWYSLKAPFLMIGYDIVQQQIPASGTFQPENINGEDVLAADFTQNNNVLMDTVFEGVFD